MNALGNALAALVVLALIGALGAGGYFAFDFIVGLLATLESQSTKAAVIASVVTLLAAVFIANSIRRAGDQKRADKLSGEKSATYRLFVELWEHLLSHGSRAENRDPAELRKDLRSLDLMLSLYGSAGVIKAHNTLRSLEDDSKGRNQDLRPHFVKALMEIRKDLGSDVQSLAVEELQQLLQPASTEAHPSSPEPSDSQRREAVESNP